MVTVPALGLGTSQLGNLGRAVSDDDAEAVITAAWDGGIRYFDTAPHYGLGLSETRVGRLLRDHPRDEWVLSTKVGRVLVPSPDTAHQRDDEGFDVPAVLRRERDYSADGARRSIDDSLERLGVDRIDIAYVHDPDEHGEQASREAIPALLRLRDEGVIGAVGVGMNDSTMLARFVTECDIDLVMCAGRFTLLEQPALRDLLPAAQSRGVGVVIAGVFNSGLLATPRPRSGATYDYAEAESDLVRRANDIADICEQYGTTLPVAAQAFPWLHPAVRSVVVGCRSAAQVRSALVADAHAVPSDLWEALAAAGFVARELLPESAR
ncbi:aldo/keto reductase [Microbacterium sp. C5A9]|uniref:aldo/keto reductase n=1 Tax=Microbacterium sp. C5A9 TaxID=2736663 RepID=UPI001F522CA0|nr:aldo/keto reductase [Microbacterium sp. C5A9]MCI1017234.1 aldo/keto reductase [Microbacterium sp. C5A9]